MINEMFFEGILRSIRRTYPSGIEKVKRSFFLENIANPLFSNKQGLKPIHQRELNHWFINIDRKVKEGIQANKLYYEVKQIRRHILHDSFIHVDEESGRIRSLEMQIAELRDMLSPTAITGKIEKKIAKLEEQIDDMQDQTGQNIMETEKQEDILKKFNSASKKAFIIMPFAANFDNVWKGGIKPACIDSHYTPLRVDEISLSSVITEDIKKYIIKANIVIVDITGNNPNAMFEFGWALAKGKKPIVICQIEQTGKIPFDLLNIRHIIYENSWLGIEKLKKELKSFLTTTETHFSKKKK